MDTVKTLVFGGGEIHDWQGIQPRLVAALEASDAFELATAQEDLDALLDLDAYDVLVFHYTVGTISDAQRDALSSWLIGGIRSRAPITAVLNTSDTAGASCKPAPERTRPFSKIM